MSSAAFSRLLKESLDATPPGLVPPTAPIIISLMLRGARRKMAEEKRKGEHLRCLRLSGMP